MFKTGQKVVCVDDQFEPWVYDLYKSLPKRDQIYTVRALRAGRSNPKFTVNDEAEIKLADAQFDILLLLKELLNPDDPHSSVKQELGFRSDRFAPLLEEPEEAEEEELVGVGQEERAWEPQPAYSSR